MASRVMPASGPVSSRSSPSSRLISVDLPELGRPTTAMRIGLGGLASSPPLSPSASAGSRRPRARSHRAAPRAAPRRDRRGPRRARRRSRSARPGRARKPRARRPRAALPSHLLATRIAGLPDRRTRSAKRAIGRQRARARVDQEQDRVGARDRGLGLLLHAAAQALGRGLFEAGGIDDAEREIAELRPALAPVAR